MLWRFFCNLLCASPQEAVVQCTEYWTWNQEDLGPNPTSETYCVTLGKLTDLPQFPHL